MKILNKLPSQVSMYQKYIDVLKPGQSVAGLDKRTAEGVRQLLYKQGYKATCIKQLDETYTVGRRK